MRVFSFHIGTEYAADRQPALTRIDARLPRKDFEAPRRFSAASWRRLQQAGERRLTVVH